MKTARSENHAQKGSALFMILIAVVLFAALGYAVSNMMRGGSPGIISEEKLKLASNEILAYGRSMRQAAQNIKISNGCSDMDISLENDIVTGYAHSPVATDNCKIFNNNGGGIVYQVPPSEWLDNSTPAPALRGKWYFPANVCAPGTGTAVAGCASDTADNEAIIAVLPYIQKQLCIQINNALNVTNPGGNPPVETGDAWASMMPKFTGAQADGQSLDQGGRMAGCFSGANGATPGLKTYHFFQILIPR